MKKLVKMIAELTNTTEQLFSVLELSDFVLTDERNLSTDVMFELIKRLDLFPSVPHYNENKEIVESTLVIVDETVFRFDYIEKTDNLSLSEMSCETAQTFIDNIVLNLQSISFE